MFRRTLRGGARVSVLAGRAGPREQVGPHRRGELRDRRRDQSAHASPDRQREGPVRRSGQRHLHGLLRAEQRVQRFARGGRHRPPDSRLALRPGHGRSPQLPAPLAKGKATTRNVHLRRPLDRPGRIARLRHQVRRHPERYRVPDVPGALVSGERLQRGSIHFGSPHHRSQRIPGDCERPGKFAARRRGQDRLQLSIQQALFSGKHRGGARRSGKSKFRGRYHDRLFPAEAEHGQRLWRGDGQDPELS